MIFTPLPLSGAFRIDLEKRGDDRGFFARAFCEKEFSAKGLNGRWAQMNISLTALAGTIRGMHFQRSPAAEIKVVRCLKGAIFDVMIDLRPNSPSYGSWYGEELTDKNRSAFYIPQGFAHGYQTLAPDCELFYMHSEFYAPEREGGLRYDDPTVGVSWPMPVSNLSPRDGGFPFLDKIGPVLS